MKIGVFIVLSILLGALGSLLANQLNRLTAPWLLVVVAMACVIAWPLTGVFLSGDSEQPSREAPPAVTSSLAPPRSSVDLTEAFPSSSFSGWSRISPNSIDNTGFNAQDYCDRRPSPPDARIVGIGYNRGQAATFVHVAEFRSPEEASKFLAEIRRLASDCGAPWTPAGRVDLAGMSFRVETLPPPKVTTPPDELLRLRLTNSRDADYSILDYIRAGQYVTLLTNNAPQRAGPLIPTIDRHLDEASQRLVKLK